MMFPYISGITDDLFICFPILFHDVFIYSQFSIFSCIEFSKIGVRL